MKSLTDERVRREMGPFDHPSLPISDGAHGEIEGEAKEVELFLPAVGRGGGKALSTFEDSLK